ncbi:hypothetical protein [Mesorhizobium sp.]|nr:hypothetical protein [Mesorhizobium sp.]
MEKGPPKASLAKVLKMLVGLVGGLFAPLYLALDSFTDEVEPLFIVVV